VERGIGSGMGKVAMGKAVAVGAMVAVRGTAVVRAKDVL